MALDGITIAALVSEIRGRLLGGRIARVAQPEKDELLLTVKAQDGQYRLLLSASASLPLAYLTDKNKVSPAEAPTFLMLLRKHIGNGRIVDISQPGLERIIRIEIEHLDEMGDLRRIFLVTELMGKYSNIILVNDAEEVIDSIRRVPANMSSVREVLPQKPYFIPDNIKKADSLTVTYDEFLATAMSKPLSCARALSAAMSGISSLMAEELCSRCGIDSNFPVQSLSDAEKEHLYHTFSRLMEDVRQGVFSPVIYYKGGRPAEFAAVNMTIFEGYDRKDFDSVSEVLQLYYAEKEQDSRIRQKSSDLRRIAATSVDRVRRKYDLQLKQLRDTEDRDRFRVYGELIRTYGYNVTDGAKEMTAPDFYNDGKETRIPLDPDLSVSDNAQRYFTRYSKLKRTHEAVAAQIVETEAELAYLETVKASLETAADESDLAQIKRELTEAGYIRRHAAAKGGKKEKAKAGKPLHFLSTDGYDIYVGKNNYQNEEVTFRIADGCDWWFHAKKQPGSHVIVKLTDPADDPPARVFNEAGMLAAYFSSGRGSDKVEIDYVRRKEVKKPAGGRPGYVIYHTNYSMVASPSLGTLRML